MSRMLISSSLCVLYKFGTRSGLECACLPRVDGALAHSGSSCAFARKWTPPKLMTSFAALLIQYYSIGVLGRCGRWRYSRVCFNSVDFLKDCILRAFGCLFATVRMFPEFPAIPFLHASIRLVVVAALCWKACPF